MIVQWYETTPFIKIYTCAPASSETRDSPFGLANSSEVRENERAEARKAARGPKADTAEEEVARRTPNIVAFMV